MNNNVDKQYLDFLRHILKNGVKKIDRTGTGTISVFDYSMRFNMSEGFPLLTSKKMFTKAVIIELMWFLKGDTNIKYLVDNGCNIWNGDAYKAYEKYVRTAEEKIRKENWQCDFQPIEIMTKEDFVKSIKTDEDFFERWGDLGPVYGAQWRNWEGVSAGMAIARDIEWGGNNVDDEKYGIDQITNLINDLRNDPDSRRLMVNAWNVSEIENMTLPPCHFGFQCYTTEMTFEQRLEHWCSSLGKHISYGNDFDEKKLDELNVPKRKLDLKWFQRSVDSFLGLPFNITSYALLLHLLAREVNMVPNDLIFSGGDCHIYLNHVDVVKKQLEQETYKLPKLELSNKSIDDIKYEDFNIIGYQSSPTLKGELSN
jgi:thymidylate synthase